MEPMTDTTLTAGAKRLVLATIEQGTRALSIRVLGGYAQSLGVPTTLLLIVKELASAGHPVTFTPSEIQQLAAWLEREGVTHLGFYLMTASLKPYRLLVPALRAQGYRGCIMAGGVHPTLCPAESLVDGADYAVAGPGELPLRMILEGADPWTIPGLVWRDAQGKTHVNAETDAQRLDLNDLPFPIYRFGEDYVLYEGRLRRLTGSFHQAHAEWRGRYYDLITSRGCPYKCAYCCNSVHHGAIRRASVERVMRELKHLREHAPMIRGINIQDDNFCTGSPQWVEEFVARMKAEIGLPFIVRLIPRFVTPERLQLLKSGGLEYVTMGLEASTRLNAKVFDRPEDSRSFLKAAKAVLEAGLMLSIDVLVDNPYEREEDLREIAETLNALPRGNWWVVYLSLTPFPNTPLHARCVKDRLMDRFATNAYDAMLMPSIEGGYRTPRFWRLLNTVVLPNVQPALGAKLIQAGPGSPKAARLVESLATWTTRTKRMTTWLRTRTPWLYSLTFHVLRLCSPRRRALPSGMRPIP
jgi:radical SAM superfamily enzyme YgiQ (UPF0313 family)